MLNIRLVLIDGRRQNSTGDITPNGFGESNNSFIPPISAIERIEVIRGPLLPFMAQMQLAVSLISLPKKFHQNGQVLSH